MSPLTLRPFLFFNDNCKEAFQFYHDALGSELSFETEDGENSEAEAGDQGSIRFAKLTSDEMVLLGMDSKIANSEARKIELQIEGGSEDRERFEEIFNNLAEGGKIKHPLEQKKRGNIQGRLYDAYGIDWIVSIRG